MSGLSKLCELFGRRTFAFVPLPPAFFFPPPRFFSLNYASPLRTLSYQVKLHEKYVKILVLLIIFVFSPSLSPFIAYCYRRNTVYPSSFNPPILIILLKSGMFSTRSNFWLLKYSPVQFPVRKKVSEERCFVKFWTNIYVKMFKQPKLGLVSCWNWLTDYFHVRRKSRHKKVLPEVMSHYSSDQASVTLSNILKLFQFLLSKKR